MRILRAGRCLRVMLHREDRLADDAAALCVRTLEALFGADDLAVEETPPAPRPARARGAMAVARPQNIGAAVFARVG